MLVPKPLKGIMDMEWETGEFIELDIFSSAGIAFAYAFLLFLLGMILNVFIGIAQNEPVLSSIYIAVVLFISFIAAAAAFLPKLYKTQNIPLSYKASGTKVGIRNLILTVLLVIGFKLLTDGALLPFVKTTGSFRNLMNAIEIIVQSPAILLIYLFVFEPVVSEVLFRGVILNGLIKRYSVMKAVILSSVLFGLVNASIYAGFTSFLFSLILSWLYLKTRSIVLCILANSFHNIYTIITLFYMPAYLSSVGTNGMPGISGFIIIGLVYLSTKSMTIK